MLHNEPIKTPGGLHNSFLTACKKADIPHGHNDLNGITLHDIWGTVKTNMLNAGVDKVYRDTILGHSLTGMDVHYMAPSEDDLHRTMTRYTAWLDSHFLQSVDQNVDQGIKKGQPD